MISINKDLLFIRVNKYEYLIKKGTISNYSFNVVDEERIGFLPFIFEEINYPIEKKELLNQIKLNYVLNEEDLSKYIDDFLDTGILIIHQEKINGEILIVAPEMYIDSVSSKFSELSNKEVRQQTVENLNFENINEEFIYTFLPYYSPSLLHEINRYCVENEKKLFITYIDGAEGIIIPLLNIGEGSCFNDYEIMRESSLYNLLDYQIMKEHLIVKKDSPRIESIKVDYILLSSLLIMNQYLESTTINDFAYSIDVERFIITKTKLFRFPKNPVNQSDRNIKHPFI